MGDIKSPSSVTIGELTRIVKEFEEKIQNGTEDPDRFLTLSEIEDLWGKLIGDTNVIYSDMHQTLIQNIDERELIREKKGIPSQRDKTSHTQKSRAPDPHTSRGSPLPQNDADSRRF